MFSVFTCVNYFPKSNRVFCFGGERGWSWLFWWVLSHPTTWRYCKRPKRTVGSWSASRCPCGVFVSSSWQFPLVWTALSQPLPRSISLWVPVHFLRLILQLWIFLWPLSSTGDSSRLHGFGVWVPALLLYLGFALYFTDPHSLVSLRSMHYCPTPLARPNHSAILTWTHFDPIYPLICCVHDWLGVFLALLVQMIYLG